jgi:hypothetical protein
MTQTNYALVDVKLTFAYLAEQPIIHTEETIGNISKLKQMRVIYKGKPVSVPALSGNSFRGQLRDILADELCSCLSSRGEQRLRFNNNETYAILYSGGALSERSTSGDLLNDFVEYLPSMRLMGAAFGNVMLPSKLAMTHVVPCAEETQEILKACTIHLKTVLFQYRKNGQAHAIFSLTLAHSRGRTTAAIGRDNVLLIRRCFPNLSPKVMRLTRQKATTLSK